MKKLFFPLFFTFFIALYICFQFFFKEDIIKLLENNLPYRESYNPSIVGVLYTYVFPFIFGILISGALTSFKTRRLIFFINLALIFSILNFLPYLFENKLFANYWFYNHVLLYYLILYPFIFILGSAPFYLNKYIEEEKRTTQTIGLKSLDVIFAFSLGILIFLLNLIPAIQSKFLVGADIYYHAAISKELIHNPDITRNPFFLEDNNYYYSIVYYLVAMFSYINGLSIQNIWFLYIPFASCIFIIFFYLFAKRYTNSTISAFIATLFIFPLNQILWVDPSVRILSYTFFAIALFYFQSFLITARKVYLLISSLFVILIAFSHTEIALHMILILLFFIVLKKLSFLKKMATKFFISISFVNESKTKSGLESYNVFLVLITIFLIILISKYKFLLSNYPIDKILIFNEIPLSVFHPIGAISILVFLFAPASIYKRFRRFSNQDIFLTSIALLFTSVIFYFTHIWVLYHRYFAETAYIALSILAADIINIELMRVNRYQRLLGIFLIFGFLFLSLIPKYNFIKTYSASTNLVLSERIKDINFVKKNTVENSVIILDPDNQINRYLPFYGERYIFSGSSLINKEHQWQVLSFCNGPFSESCNKRLALADELFSNPSTEAVKKIKQQYKVDYLLVNKTNNEELMKFLNSNLNLQPLKISESNNYILFDMRSI
jgi:hypothetical protein